MESCIKILVAIALLAPLPAGAVLIEIAYADPDIVRAKFDEIDDIADRVYTLRIDEDGKAEVGFGDGVQGARPGSGGAVVASYRYGSGSDGKIVNEYEVTASKLPFIPATDFLPANDKQPGVSFILVGLSSIQIDFSPAGLRVGAAELSPTVVPIPATVWLVGSALLGLAGLRRRRQAAVPAHARSPGVN